MLTAFTSCTFTARNNCTPARVSESFPPHWLFCDHWTHPLLTKWNLRLRVFLSCHTQVLNHVYYSCMRLNLCLSRSLLPPDPGGECIPQLHLPLWGAGETWVANVNPQLHDPPWIPDRGLWAPYSPHRWHRRRGRCSHQAQLRQPS